MALYTSEFTQFLQKLRAERPYLDSDQREGRAIWWDKEPIDMDRTRRNLQSRIAQQAYPYQPMDDPDQARNLPANGKVRRP
ncbi:MAG: DUF3460 family protein [Burkholderiaceae bacterium]